MWAAVRAKARSILLGKSSGAANSAHQTWPRSLRSPSIWARIAFSGSSGHAVRAITVNSNADITTAQGVFIGRLSFDLNVNLIDRPPHSAGPEDAAPFACDGIQA